MKCETCKHWKKLEDTNYQKDMGTCTKLSAPENEDYPEVDETGIESTPICWHDGIGVNYETKKWFGCVHHPEFKQYVKLQ